MKNPKRPHTSEQGRAGRHSWKHPTLRHFAFEHLPPNLQEVSRPFGELAAALVARLPKGGQLDLALTLLLQAKDAAVRAYIEGQSTKDKAR